MDDVFAKISENAVKFNLGDEEVSLNGPFWLVKAHHLRPGGSCSSPCTKRPRRMSELLKTSDTVLQREGVSFS
jgi:hypothetical protein